MTETVMGPASIRSLPFSACSTPVSIFGFVARAADDHARSKQGGPR